MIQSEGNIHSRQFNQQNSQNDFKTRTSNKRVNISQKDFKLQDNSVLDSVLMFGSRGEVDPKINICFEVTANMAWAAM